MSESSQAAHREREHFFGAAKVVAGMTLLSRVAGMVRTSAVASLGANALTDAFSLAWTIPNLFRRLFAEGALSSAFVPIFTQISEDPAGGPEKANRLLANSVGILGAFLLGLMALVQIGLGVWGTLWPGASDRQLLILLTVIMLPFMVTICLLALASAALNCRGHFLYPAATPIILNGVIILGVLLFAPLVSGDAPGQLKVVAFSVSAAGIIQLAGIVWFLRSHGFSLRPRLRPVESGIGPMLRLMGPMLIPLGFLQMMELLEKVLGWVLRSEPGSETINILGLVFPKPLDVGVLPRLDAARNLYQFPMGVFAISVGVAIFPLLARYAARADMPSFRASLNRALRLTFMEGLATGAGLFLLAEPISWVLYRHRKFNSDDVRQTADILRAYLLGMWAFCSQPMLVRAFYALKDTRTPLKVSCVLAPLEVLLLGTLIWIPGIGPRAFGLATATTLTINACALAVLLRRRLGLIGGRKILASAIRSALACAAMAAAVVGLQWMLAGQCPWLAIREQPAWVVVAVCVPAGAAVFFAAAVALRSPELGELFGVLRRRTPEESPPPTR
jgi:putative peptidoglycan lipid II flippase